MCKKYNTGLFHKFDNLTLIRVLIGPLFARREPVAEDPKPKTPLIFLMAYTEPLGYLRNKRLQ